MHVCLAYDVSLLFCVATTLHVMCATSIVVYILLWSTTLCSILIVVCLYGGTSGLTYGLQLCELV